MEKDYSLLRPFDLEAAKRGENVCWHEDGDTAIEVFFPKQGGIIPVFSGNDQCGIFTDIDCEQLKMSPLAWVEGRPVYKGDVLYVKHNSAQIEVEWINACGVIGPKSESGWSAHELTWKKPKTKREGWVNLSTRHTCSSPYPTKADADRGVIYDLRIACIRIEWFE